jgi:hypothetical protein
MNKFVRFVFAFLVGFLAVGLHAAGNLKVTLSPSAAVSAGAQWRVDSGAWQASGATVKSLVAGSHTVSFKTISGWIAPTATTANIVNGATTTLTATYVQAAKITIALTPSSAQWRIDGGAWLASGTTVSNLVPGTHTIEYAALAGYQSPANESVTLNPGDAPTLQRSYTQLARLTVTLTPSSAQWRVDGGAWMASGATAANLAPGTHAVDYASLTGYAPLASESVTLAAGQDLTFARTYTQLAQLTITLSQSSGQWRVDGGAWQASGATLANLLPGDHAIQYSALTYYQSPSDETLTLSAGQSLSLQRNYIQLSQIIIGLSPTSGQWRANGGAWQPSGASLWVLPGTYVIDYSAIDQYDSPPSETITFPSPGGLFATTRYYILSNGSLHIDLTPASAQWRVDGGAWQTSGTTLVLPRGQHTVDYTFIAGYATQGSENITIVGGQLLSYSRTYTQLGQVSVVLDPTAAMWRVDGGSWLPSGATSQYLLPGSHSIDYKDVSGYLTPASESATVTAGQVLTLNRSYVTRPQLTVALTPSSAQWRLDAGPWLASGTTVSNLSEGSHTIDYAPVTGYVTPASETVTLANGQPLSLSRTYAPATASLTVVIDPSSAQWRLDGPVTTDWTNSGVTVTSLPAGTYLITYGTVSDYIAPNAQGVIVLSAGDAQTVTKTYPPKPGSIQVIAPIIGSQWRTYPAGTTPGNTWYESGVTVSGLPVGDYVVEYWDVPNYTAPPTETVTVGPNQAVALTRTYTPYPASVTLTLAPDAAQWRIYPESSNPSPTWVASGATVGSLTPGNYTIDSTDVDGFTNPGPQPLTISAGQVLTLTRTYAAAAQLTITLTPASGQWRIDSGDWQPSGATVRNLAAGGHSVEYMPVDGYPTPDPEAVVLESGQALSLSRIYADVAPLTVNLVPDQGRWRVDGGDWQQPNTTVPNLLVGDHILEFEAVDGYVAPPTETINVPNRQPVTLTRYYQQLSQLQVMMNPLAAQWRIDGGVWHNSGDIATNLSFDTPHTIEYAPVEGYVALPSETVTLYSGQQLQIWRGYQPLSQLRVYLVPSNAQWRIDAGPWHNSGDTAVNLAFDTPHTIDYAPADGYVALPSETVTLYSGQQLEIWRGYQPLSQLHVYLMPSNAQWRIDGGPWRNSGDTAINLAFDTPHIIDYAPTDGYVALPSETVTLYSGQQLEIWRGYQPLSQLRVYLMPSTAQWRVDGGTWQSSGDTAINLSFDTPHTIDYAPADGYVAPPSESVTLYSGQQLEIWRSYSPLSQLQVYIMPSSAQWRVDGGTWHNSGDIVTHLAFDVPHTVEYGPADGYVALPSETVTLYSGQQLSMSRAYTPLAQVTVNTYPYQGQWRIDGGAWTDSGVTVGNLSFDTQHLIEFLPARSWGAPPPQRVTLYSGEQRTVSAHYSYLGTHRLRFFVSPALAGALSPAELQNRLSQYASHVTAVFTRETQRAFTFDPTTDVVVTDTDPFSAETNTSPPQSDFEIWIHATLTDDPIVGTYGGVVGSDTSGAGGVHGLKWDQIYDPATLADGSPQLEQYWRQVHLMLRGLEQMFGAGIGGYDTLAGLKDLSGITPMIADTAPVDSAVADAFWTDRFDFWTDPLTANAYGNPRLGSPTSLPALLNLVSFAPATRGVINGNFRGPAYASQTLPDMTQVAVYVTDFNTGEAISGATVRIWNRQDPANPTSTYEEAVAASAMPGMFFFSWTGAYDPFSAANNAKLVKISAPGYTDQAQWVTIYDAQKSYLVDGQGIHLVLFRMKAP